MHPGDVVQSSVRHTVSKQGQHTATAAAQKDDASPCNAALRWIQLHTPGVA
jgi:hypothetical protein